MLLIKNIRHKKLSNLFFSFFLASIKKYVIKSNIMKYYIIFHSIIIHLRKQEEEEKKIILPFQCLDE